jgi:hypothetical protein
MNLVFRNGVRWNSPANAVLKRAGIETVQSLWFVALIYGSVLGLLAIPIVSVVVPPLIDYPNHLARMHILAAYADSPELRTSYVVVWKLAPYLAMDLIVPQLARFMSIYTAGQVFLYLCLTMFVAGTAAVHAALYRRLSAWPAASALIAYSFVVSFGFVNYLFGMGVWLLAFAAWIVLSRNTVRWRLIGGSILSLAVFFSHFFAFFGYMLCVGSYELGVWLVARDHRLRTLIRNGVVAFCPFIVPLIIFVMASSGQEGGVTLYATPHGWIYAQLSPLLFPGAPADLAILAIVLVIPARLGLLGKLHLAPAMWAPLIAVGCAAMAMPNVLSGVWGVDYRLPVVFAYMLIAGCSWHEVSTPRAHALGGFLVALLAVNVGLIVAAWHPVGQQFEEFRAALIAIPRGAKVIVFRDEAGINPSLMQPPAELYDHLATLAVIERDAYVPFLFKHKMMPVETVAALRKIDTAIGKPIGLSDLIAGADPVRGPAMLGTLGSAGVHNYWGDWPRNYDYAVEFSFGGRPELPDQLERVATGSFFNIYRIRR